MTLLNMEYDKLKEAIVSCYEGVKETDNGDSRNHWNHDDFTDEELAEIAEEIITYYKQLVSTT